MFNLFERAFKSYFKTAIVITVGIAGLAYFTKPSQDSLAKILLRTNNKNDNMDVSVVHDHLFYKSTTPALSNRCSYIGIFNHWIVKNE